jgi:predicted DNA-binding transcriptional regulator YafY
MRRADRLFRVVEILRRRKVVTCRQLATELEVAPRTVYRDIADLVSCGVPIRGEAGVGYALESGYDMPPLMFTIDEIEALVLGARMIQAWCDPDLASAAAEAVAKVEQAVPKRLAPRVERTALVVPKLGRTLPGAEHHVLLRHCIRDHRVVRLFYRDIKGAETRRDVHPLGLFFWGGVVTLGGWCTLRDGFRTFRPDRILEIEALDETFEPVPGRSLQDLIDAVSRRE